MTSVLVEQPEAARCTIGGIATQVAVYVDATVTAPEQKALFVERIMVLLTSYMGHSRHCRGGRKSAFVRFTPLATFSGMGPNGRDVPLTDIDNDGPISRHALIRRMVYSFNWNK